jgi:hypothetical protein
VLELLADQGLSIRDVAARIGADPDRAEARWPEHGVPNRWVSEVRRLAADQ